MRSNKKGILGIFNEKIRLMIFITVYLFLLKRALSLQIENPYFLACVYLLLPPLWGLFILLIYDRILLIIKRGKI